MASLYVRLVDVRTLGPNEKQDLKDIADVGAYSKLAIQPRVIKAGTGGNLDDGVMKHLYASCDTVLDGSKGQYAAFYCSDCRDPDPC